jgi:hypothetical protein
MTQPDEWKETSSDIIHTSYEKKGTKLFMVIENSFLNQIRREAENKLISELYERNLICNGYNEGERYLEQRRAKTLGENLK